MDVQYVDWQSRARGGGAVRVMFSDALAVTGEPGHDLVALDDALEGSAAVDARKAQVVELRFFGGLNVQETATALTVSVDTVMRDWKLARAWLLRELRDQTARGRPAGEGMPK